MATHSSILAWDIPWTEEPGELQIMGSQKIGRDSVVKNLRASAGDAGWVRKIPWRRKWQPTPAFLPGKSQGQRSLGVYSPWGGKELDMT